MKLLNFIVISLLKLKSRMKSHYFGAQSHKQALFDQTHT